jgi:hypothetical protein
MMITGQLEQGLVKNIINCGKIRAGTLFTASTPLLIYKNQITKKQRTLQI